jgi:hypothetical protein
MKRYNNLFLLISALMITGFAGCKKVLNKPPLTSITSVNYFKTGDDAESAIIGCYDALQDPNYYGASLNLMGELPSDNVTTLNPQITDMDQIRWTPTSPFPVGVYTQVYIAINRVNSVIKYVPGITENIVPARRSQILGEAHFLRALHYFNLVKSFGGVPLHLEPTETASQSAMARSTPEEVYAQIEQDLSTAEPLLPVTYGNVALDRTRVTVGAVNALQAKVYLYERKWDLAVAAANKVITNPDYGTLTTPWNSLFPFKNHQESILEVQYSGAADGGFTLPDETLPSPPATYSYPKFNLPTAELMSYVDTLNDIRWKRVGPVLGGVSYGSVLLATSASANDNGWFVYKWRSGNFFSSLDNNPILMLDDIYLIEAEASNELNGPNPDALSKLNAIRTRAGLPALTLGTLATKDAFRDEVDKQRRLELAFVGERWFDLVRYARQTIADPTAVHQVDALTIIKQFRGTADQNYFLFAIPLTELDTNPLIKQNPGF